MSKHTICLCLSILWLAAPGGAQTVATHMNGGCFPNATTYAGRVAQVADYDGDGIRDYIVGANGFGSAGAAMIYSAATGDILHRFEGETNGDDKLGIRVADAGDVDGDGIDDVAISATQTSPSGLGYVVVMSGAFIAANIAPPGTNPCVTTGGGFPWTTVVSTAGTPGQEEVCAIRGLPGTPGTFGISLDCRDTDGDGIREFLIGAGTEPPNGAAWLLSGSALRALSMTMFTTTTLNSSDPAVIQHYTGTTASGSFGDEVAFIGDIDGDGDEDFAIGEGGANGGHGRIHVYSGGASPVFIQRYEGSSNMLGLGFRTIVGLGDLDGDGRDEFAAGARNNAAFPGAVYVFDGDLVSQGQNMIGGGPGGTFVLPDPHAGPCAGGTVLIPLQACLVGTTANDLFGAAITTCDLDGDGAAEIVIGAPDLGGGLPGKVHVVSPADLSTELVISGSSTGDLFGLGLARLDDVNGDGRDDLLVGASSDDTLGVDLGTVTVLTLPTTTLPDMAQIHGEQGVQAGEQFGGEGGSIGDVTGDGIPDYAVGAVFAAVPAAETGRLAIYDGDTNALIHVLEGPSLNDRFGVDPTALDDVNGDGTPDFAVSAPRSGAIGSLTGSVYVISGAHVATMGTTTISNNGTSGAELLVFHGSSNNGLLGNSVANLGDLNGDGFAELAISSQTGGVSGVGEVFVLKGAGLSANVGSVFSPLTSSDTIVEHYLVGSDPAGVFGIGLASVGFVDADAFPDFAVGEPNALGGAGRVEVYSGVSANVIMTYTAPGTAALGRRVVGMGDLNADGRDEFAVSGPGGGGTNGNVWIFDGLTVALSQGVGGTILVGDPQLGPCGTPSIPAQPIYRCIAGGPAADDFGRRLAAVDFDGNGLRDLAIGISGTLTGTFQAYSVHGSIDLLLTASGPGVGDGFGGMLANLGDRNSDARDELLVGIPLSNQTGVDAGAIVIYGANAPYAGSNEDYIQVSGIDEAPNGIAVKDAPANVPVTLNYSVETPGDTWVGEHFLIIAEAFTTGTPPTPIPGFPELHLDPSNLFILFNSAGACVPSPFGGPPICPSLPGDRIDFSYGIPMGPANMSVLIQSVVISTQASNGFFVTSPAHEIRFM